MSLNSEGIATTCDWERLHRQYHIQCQYPFVGYTVYDVENVGVCLDEDCCYLVEVQLPTHCQRLYLDDTFHRRHSASIKHSYKILLVSDYFEISRYKINNQEDIQTLKNKGLFVS